MHDEETKPHPATERAHRLKAGDIVRLVMVPADSNLDQDLLGQWLEVVECFSEKEGEPPYAVHCCKVDDPRNVIIGISPKWLRRAAVGEGPVSAAQATAQAHEALERDMRTFLARSPGTGESLAERVIQDNGRLREEVRRLEAELEALRSNQHKKG